MARANLIAVALPILEFLPPVTSATLPENVPLLILFLSFSASRTFSNIRSFAWFGLVIPSGTPMAGQLVVKMAP
jgi:hypothetical protein